MKPCVAPHRGRFRHIEPLDPRMRRAVADVLFEAIQRFDFTFDVNFHAAVGRVRNPPVEAFSAGGRPREHAEPHALNAAAD